MAYSQAVGAGAVKRGQRDRPAGACPDPRRL